MLCWLQNWTDILDSTQLFHDIKSKRKVSYVREFDMGSFFQDRAGIGFPPSNLEVVACKFSALSLSLSIYIYM